MQAHELAAELAKLGVDAPVQISCGLEVVEKARAGAGFKVNILDPQGYYDDFDMIVISSHEPHAEHKNIVEITGLLNHISPEFLQGKERVFGLGGNITAVLVGGKHIGGNFTVDDAARLAAEINKAGRPVVVTTSKRTEEAAAKLLAMQIKVPHVFYDFNAAARVANPYEAMLASCKNIIVTADSVRMVSEAASSGREISIFTPSQTHFSYIALRDKVLNAKLPLRESTRIADLIKMRIIGACKNNFIS